MTVAAALLTHAHRDPRRRAVTVGGRRVCYAELAEGILATGARLRGRCDPDARVGVLLPPGVAFLEVFLGAGQVGMAAMVLHPGWSGQELRIALEAGRPALVVTSPALAARFRDELAGATVVTVGGPGSPALGGSFDAAAGSVPPGDASTTVADDRVFYIGFTSGTTAGPRGFLRDHRSWLRSFDACREFGIGADDEVAVPGNLAHSLFLFAALHALSEGAGVHLQPRFDAPALAGSLEDVPITRLYVVPSMLGPLLRTPLSGPPPDPTRRATALRSLISSGAPWPPALLDEVADRFPGTEVIDFYGSSETSFVSFRRVRATDPPTDLGRPFPGVEVRVAEETGRLRVRSGMLFSGYLDARATDRIRDREGFVATGDIVSVDGEGRLQLVGRADATIICGGVNIHPEQIERVLEQHPKVVEAVVVAIPDPVWGQVPCAVVRLVGNDRPSRGALRVHCRQRLAAAARPRRFLVTEDLPRTPNAKPDRRSLATQVADGTVAAEPLR